MGASVSTPAHLETEVIHTEARPTSKLGFWMQSGFLLFRKEIISWGPFIIPSLSVKQDSSLAKLRQSQSVLVLCLLFLD